MQHKMTNETYKIKIGEDEFFFINNLKSFFSWITKQQPGCLIYNINLTVGYYMSIFLSDADELYDNEFLKFEEHIYQLRISCFSFGYSYGDDEIQINKKFAVDKNSIFSFNGPILEHNND